MASSQIFIPRDDALGNGLSLGGGRWTYVNGVNNYGGETIWPAFAENATSPMGSMSVTFQGTSIAFIGNTPGNDTTKTSQIFTITIDDNQPYNSSTSDPNPQNYMQWYQSPTLPSGTHTIAVGHMFALALDYMVITPAQDTPLVSQILMVDDYYEGIKYAGSWQGSTGQKLDTGAGNTIGAFPFQNSSHRTTTVGDSLSFSYTGTNMSVYGVYPWQNAGSVSVSYTIDGGSSFKSSFTSPGPSGLNIGQQPHFKLVDTGPLSAGNHTVNLTLTGCINQFLMIDYILYTPSFSNLASMPNLTATNTQGSGGSGTTTGVAGATTTGSGPTNTDTSTPAPSKSNTGAIAGGVVGGIAALAILAALVFFFLRRRRPSQTQPADDTQQVLTGPTYAPRIQNIPNSPYLVEPFTGPPTPGFQPSSSSKHSPGLSSSDSGFRPSTSTFPAGLAGPASISTNTTSTSPSHIQADNKRQIEGLQNLVTAHEAPGNSGTDNVEELKRRIQYLQEQNAHLATLSTAPPAYHSQ